MLALYPIHDVDVSVGSPMPWSGAVQADGTGWDELLQAVVDKRAQDHVAINVYYYGVFAPAASMDSYCQQGCVAGLSPLSYDASDDYSRGSIGLDYTEKYAASDVTFVHELGHAHGRAHAPCEVPDPDPEYPHANAEIGIWGYSFAKSALLDPTGQARDMMSYCSPTWISDYTYQALFDRITEINQMPKALHSSVTYHSILVRGDGIKRGGSVTLPASSSAHQRTVERVTSGGVEKVSARYYPFDHLPGGILLVPESADYGQLRFEGRAL
jgi:hypothetical protein